MIFKLIKRKFFKKGSEAVGRGRARAGLVVRVEAENNRNSDEIICKTHIGVFTARKEFLEQKSKLFFQMVGFNLKGYFMNKLLSISLCELEQGKTGDSITYNDGQGVKDTIVMTGPLSSIYTKALNIFFQKKELTVPSEGAEAGQQDSVSVATESAAIQTVLDNGLINFGLTDEEPDPEDGEQPENNLEVFNSVKIVDAGTELTDPPKAIIYAGAAGTNVTNDELEVIQADFDRYADSDKDWVLFIGPLKNGTDDGVDLQYQKVNKDINAFNVGDSFKRATEDFYGAMGIPVVVGFENLAEWLLKRSK